MSSVLRRLMMKKNKKESDARQRLKKELFAYSRGENLGFPSKPTSLDCDPVLSLIVIGTKTGGIHIYGAPGVELYAQNPNDSAILQVSFLIGQARLITLCNDDSINLWEVDLNNDLSSLRRVARLMSSESKMEEMFRCCISNDSAYVLVMSESGSILEIDVVKFSIKNYGDDNSSFVPLSVILNGAPSDLMVNIGRVISFISQPLTSDKFLIGYSSGLIVIWDHCNKKSIRYFNTNQYTESLSFSPDGSEFVSSHSDGSYIVWSTGNSSRPKDQPACPYGPFPCSSIHIIKWRPMKSGDTYLFFSGGMPRAGHSDKNTVTVMNHNSCHVVFEFSSRVVDFIIFVGFEDDHCNSSAEEVLSLLILAEEEFVAIDLFSPDWPTFDLPYLQNIQSSPILCSAYRCDGHPHIIDALIENANLKIRSNPKLSQRDWPLVGGRCLNKISDIYRILVLGHEDGSIEFFSPIRTGFRQIYRLNTSRYFIRPGHNINNDDRGGGGDDDDGKKSFDPDDDIYDGRRCFDDIEEWPPFRKVGTFDPRGDDPQLSIRHLVLSRRGQQLIAAGNSGQIMLFEFVDDGTQHQSNVNVFTINIVEENSGFSWVGLEPLNFEPGRKKTSLGAGYQLTKVVQVIPPVEPTCITFDEESNLLSVGTVYGYAVFDLQNHKTVMTKRTLIPQGTSRFFFKTRSMSLKKSFGDSFRKFKGKKKGDAIGTSRPKESSGNSREAILVSSGDDGQRNSSSMVSRSSETSPSTSKPHPTGSSSSQTLPILPSSSTHSKRQRSNSETRSNPELTENCSEDDDEDVDDGRSRNSRRSTPSRSTVPNTQKLMRPKRAGFKKIVGRCQSVEESKITEVSTLSFAKTFLTPGQPPILTLWVGTNVGGVYVHQLELPSAERQAEERISCCLAKEINFKRRHPVIFIGVLSRSMRPISRSCESDDIHVEGHSVVIVTQGQFKLFSLPSLKMVAKFNQIGVPDPPRICKADVVSFVSRSDENYIEHNLVCLTNHDHLVVFNFPQLKIQLKINNLRLNGSMAEHAVISQYGEVLLFLSQSELCHLSLSTRSTVQNWCCIDLVPGSSRPAIRPVEGEGGVGDGVMVVGRSVTEEDLRREQPLPHVVVSEHQDDGGDERPAESDADASLNSPQTFQTQQSLISPDSESELSGSVSLTGHIPSSAPFRTRSVTSSRTIMSRSTVSRSINGEIITETSTDLERINIGNLASLESDV